MTLKYKLFGKPGNVEEFIDKLKKEGIRQVILRSEYGYYPWEFPFPGDLASFFLVFEDPKGEIRYKEEVTFYSPFTAVDCEKEVYEKAKEWAKKLKELGFEVMIKPPIFLKKSNTI